MFCILPTTVLAYEFMKYVPQHSMLVLSKFSKKWVDQSVPINYILLMFVALNMNPQGYLLIYLVITVQFKELIFSINDESCTKNLFIFYNI